ncbi:rod shape determining protein RodA [Acetitomaculum ruminis DSM 5522]|uniref:Rod shape determining protein RodA n=1 Tax=Acetitomaculum ruminis DSM 5522 TaxID=1120918 RepID=A0A1I0V5E7_9FIRM|nr:FtsW/RodA/SpoVE family cell cycle protein [Acetitomaculum ruminis]SFA71521.1 rod shape determining protein RodA [Acetitomaculum ruminis DSM 5522]
MRIRYNIRYYRFSLVVLAVVLSCIGIVLVGSAEADLESRQMIGLLGGLFVMVVASVVDYNYILNFSWIIYVFNIILLISVRFLGRTVGGSQRWISIAGIQFQPSELSKLLIILFFAKFFQEHIEEVNTLKFIILSSVLMAIPTALILLQPDLSTTIVVALLFCVLYFISGLSIKIILGVLALLIPGGIIFFINILNGNLKPILGYQYNRIISWLRPEEYTDLSYQQTNSITAIGSGMLFGKGLNNNLISSVKNGNFLSESQTDFIFAVAGEELGFVGCMVIIGLLILIAFECFWIARNANDISGKLICCGVGSWISFQGGINICVATRLLPNTGLPLPFVSYGLTSLMTLFLAIGVVLNVGLQRNTYARHETIR